MLPWVHAVAHLSLMLRAVVLSLRHKLQLLALTLKENSILEVEEFGSKKLLIITDTVSIEETVLKTIPNGLSTTKQSLFENHLTY